MVGTEVRLLEIFYTTKHTWALIEKENQETQIRFSELSNNYELISKSGLIAFSQPTPFQTLHAEVHSRPSFLQLQAFVLHPLEHVHRTIRKICAGAGLLVDVTRNSLFPINSHPHANGLRTVPSPFQSWTGMYTRKLWNCAASEVGSNCFGRRMLYVLQLYQQMHLFANCPLFDSAFLCICKQEFLLHILLFPPLQLWLVAYGTQKQHV